MTTHLQQRLRQVWKHRFNIGDATSTFEIHTPASAIRDPKNPLRVTKTADVVTSYADVLGGWFTALQDDPDGLHVNRKTGQCIIPLMLVDKTYNQIKAAIVAEGVRCYLNDEQVKVTMIQNDELANAIVIDLERVE